MSRFAGVLAALACLVLTIGGAAAQAPVPALTGRVVDTVGVLTPAQKSEIESSLAALEQRKGSQVAVLIVASTKPETIEQYAIRVAEAWKIGRGGVDDGVVVVVAQADRTMRVEVGYGLEGAIPDVAAYRLIQEYFLPRFREGDYYGGIRAGVDRIIGLIDGEPLPEPRRAPGSMDLRSIEALLPLFLIMVFAVGGLLRAMFGRLPAAALVGGATGVLAWLIAAPLMIALVVGMVGFVLTLFGGLATSLPRGSHGPWGGGFGRGGGFGGGGFGGGGGGFGGGGASGRW